MKTLLSPQIFFNGNEYPEKEKLNSAIGFFFNI